MFFHFSLFLYKSGAIIGNIAVDHGLFRGMILKKITAVKKFPESVFIAFFSLSHMRTNEDEK